MRRRRRKRRYFGASPPSLPPWHDDYPPSRYSRDDYPTEYESHRPMRETFQRWERSLSPRGHLRGWLKMNLLVFLWLGIPILLFVPLLGFLVEQVEQIMASIRVIVEDIAATVIPLSITLAVLILFILFILFIVR